MEHGPKVARWTRLAFFHFFIPSWVFRSMEAPSRFGYYVFLNKTGLKDLFNWTMSYRMDSDIPTPFGRLIESYVTTPKNYGKL